MQTDSVGLARDCLALHVHVDAPRARPGQRFLVHAADALHRRRLATLAVAAGERRITAHEIRIRILLTEIPEVDEDALRRILAVEVLVLEAVEFTAGAGPVIVVADVLA